MPKVILTPPTLTPATAKFVSISNVLGGIRDYDHDGLVDPKRREKTATHFLGGRALGKQTVPPSVARLLRIGWQTELAARVGDEIDDDLLRRVAAQTLPVQAYYALFNVARAATTIGGAAHSTHQAIHRDFQSQVARRCYRSWGATLTGDPEDLSTCKATPLAITPVGFNPMELSHPPEEYVFAALRMTRRWKIELKRAKWLNDNKKRDGSPRKRLPRAERQKIVAGVPPTTLMDFVYELRRRTNYEGVEEYGSDADDATIRQFHRGLLHVADQGLLHYEAMFARHAGVAALKNELQEWTKSSAKLGKWATVGVERRVAAIETVARNP